MNAAQQSPYRCKRDWDMGCSAQVDKLYGVSVDAKVFDRGSLIQTIRPDNLLPGPTTVGQDVAPMLTKAKLARLIKKPPRASTSQASTSQASTSQASTSQGTTTAAASGSGIAKLPPPSPFAPRKSSRVFKATPAKLSGEKTVNPKTAEVASKLPCYVRTFYC
jgi:hypothetical protein